MSDIPFYVLNTKKTNDNSSGTKRSRKNPPQIIDYTEKNTLAYEKIMNEFDYMSGTIGLAKDHAGKFAGMNPTMTLLVIDCILYLQNQGHEIDRVNFEQAILGSRYDSFVKHLSDKCGPKVMKQFTNQFIFQCNVYMTKIMLILNST